MITYWKVGFENVLKWKNCLNKLKIIYTVEYYEAESKIYEEFLMVWGSTYGVP